MYQWIITHEYAFWWLGFLSLITFIGTLAIIPILVIRIPVDYFTREKRPPSRWRNHHPFIRLSVVMIKNVLGAVLILAGVAMLFLPGQGIITILVGITLLNFPGKMALERWIIKQRLVSRAVNWLRIKAHRPELQIPQQ